MVIEAKDIKPIIADFLDNVVIPKSDAKQIFFLTFFSLQKANQIDSMVNQYMPYISTDEENTKIDLDFTKNNALLALEKSGGILNIPYLNWNMDKADMLKIFDIARKYAK